MARNNPLVRDTNERILDAALVVFGDIIGSPAPQESVAP